MDLVVKKGLDIPIKGKPSGFPEPLIKKPRFCALNFEPFEDIRFKVHCKVGDKVKIGQPLAESKSFTNLQFVAPGAGEIKEIRRGLKRRLLDIVIELSEKEEFVEHPPLLHFTKENLLNLFLIGGAFPHIRVRPLNLVATPLFSPRDIFVKAVETLPFAPSAEMQLEGQEELFEAGLNALTKITFGKVHLVYHKNTTSAALLHAKNVEKHTVSGPHPAGNSSVHIHKIAPIRALNDYVWTLSILDVLVVGSLVAKGKYYKERIVSVAGEGILEEKRKFLKARAGIAIDDLIKDRKNSRISKLISGDPLTGTSVEERDFLSFNDTTLSAIPENLERQFLHFLRLGTDKYSATRAYATGHAHPPPAGYSFTTNLHGEPRAFIDGEVYDKVMPMRIPTMQLIKAILANDFQLAEQLGLLEVISEDFALSTFICPSKIEMMSIVKSGLHQYAKEMGVL